MGLVVRETLISELNATNELILHHHQYCLISEFISAEPLSAVSGDVWEAWAFNGGKFEPSIYSGFSFNSYVVEDGLTYAAREEGIYVLDNTTDAGEAIHSGVVLSQALFGTLNRKRFPSCFFEVDGAAPIVRAEVSGLGASIPIMKRKAVIPRTMVGEKWTFLVADFDELGRIELFPTILTR